MQYTFLCAFLCRCFARLHRDNSRNFIVNRFGEEMLYVFSFTFFYHCRLFSPCIASRLHFSFRHRRYKMFMLFFQPKKCLLFFNLSLYTLVALFSLSLAGLPPTFSSFLSFSCSIFQICDTKINLSIIHVLKTTRIQKQFPLSVFVLIDSLVVSVLQDAGGYAISLQNNLELHLGCHTCSLSYFTLVCLWCGRLLVWAVSVRSRDYQIFWDG